MPDQPGGGGNADQKHDSSGSKQETQESHQQAHYRISVSTMTLQLPAPCFASTQLSKLPFHAKRIMRRAGGNFLINSKHLTTVFIGPSLWPN
jgi:hypothetical protein